MGLSQVSRGTGIGMLGLEEKLKWLYNLMRVLEIEGMACAQLALNTNFKVYY